MSEESNFFEQLSFNNQPPAAGKVLISEPFLMDPNFSRSVILLAQHDEDGSVGFVLNDETGLYLHEVVADFPEVENKVYAAGPVGTDSLFFIHRLGDKIPNSEHIYEDIYWGGDFDKVRELANLGLFDKKDFLFFIGYSGWSEGQLIDELEQKAWIVADIPSSAVLKAHSKSFWNKTMASLGEKFRIMSNFPENPQMN